MKRITFSVLAVTMFVALAACKDATSQQEKTLTEATVNEVVQVQKETITRINVATLEAQMSKEGIQLVDVRTDGEWAQGHLKDAKHFEMNNPAWETQINTLDKDQPVYVYCAKGGRSARCAKKLEQAGFTEIYDLKGGITDWKAAGKPVE